MNPWLLIGLLVSGAVLLWAFVPDLRGFLLLGGFGALGVWAFRSKPYPEGRSKAHGVDKEQLRRARALEAWLREETPERSGDEWVMRSNWSRVTEQAGLRGSTFLDVEASPTGFLLRIEVPGGTPAEVRNALPKLEASDLNAAPGSMESEQDRTRARVFHIKWRTVAPDLEPIPWPGPPRDASIYDPVQLGAYVDADAGPLEHPLAYQHVLIAGASGSGKSVVLNAEVAHVAACRDAVLWGCDLKGGVELGPWEPVFQRLATTTSEAEELLEAAVAELERRGPLLKARGLRKWQFTSSDPALVIAIDEHARLSYAPRAKKALEQIMEQGRALGVILITALQKPTKDALGSNRIGPNLTVKICLRVANTNEVGVALGPGSVSDGWAAHEIPKSQPGTLYLHGPDAEYPRLARAFHVTDAKVDQAVRRLQVGTSRAGQALVPPPGTVPTDDTQPDEPGQGGGEEPDDVLSILRGHGEPMRASEIVIRSAASRPTVYRRLSEYRDQAPPLVEQLGDGRWRAVS